MIGIDNIEKAVRDPELIAEMLGIWESSVRASHHFLTDGDILRLMPQAEEALHQIETLWGVKDVRCRCQRAEPIRRAILRANGLPRIPP